MEKSLKKKRPPLLPKRSNHGIFNDGKEEFVMFAIVPKNV